MVRPWRSAWVWMVLIVGLLYGGLILVHSFSYHKNLSGFICLGDQYMPAKRVPPGTLVMANSVGYDGTFFYMMAHDPLIRGDLVAFMDAPAYRSQRVGYPLLVWLAALGQPRWFPEAMVAVNLAAVLAGMLGVVGLCRLCRCTPWYGLAYALLSGLIIALFRDLAGPVAMAWLVWTVVAHMQRRYWLAAALMSGAVLTRESLAVMLPVFWFDAWFVKDERRRSWTSWVPLLPFMGWQGYVALRVGKAPWREGVRNFGTPLRGLFDQMRMVLPDAHRMPAEKVYLVLFLLASLLALLLALWEVRKQRNAIALGFLGFSLMPLVMTAYVWSEPWAYGRVLLPGGVFLVLNAVWSRNRWHLVPLGLHVILFGVFLDWNKLVWRGHTIIGELWAVFT